jgi:hypothetical protein
MAMKRAATSAIRAFSSSSPASSVSSGSSTRLLHVSNSILSPHLFSKTILTNLTSIQRSQVGSSLFPSSVRRIDHDHQYIFLFFFQLNYYDASVKQRATSNLILKSWVFFPVFAFEIFLFFLNKYFCYIFK